MNMNENSTVEELKGLLAAFVDKAGNHLLWVDREGEVHIKLLGHRP